jgi:hypothetical protein
MPTLIVAAVAASCRLTTSSVPQPPAPSLLASSSHPNAAFPSANAAFVSANAAFAVGNPALPATNAAFPSPANCPGLNQQALSRTAMQHSRIPMQHPKPHPTALVVSTCKSVLK